MSNPEYIHSDPGIDEATFVYETLARTLQIRGSYRDDALYATIEIDDGSHFEISDYHTMACGFSGRDETALRRVLQQRHSIISAQNGVPRGSFCAFKPEDIIHPRSVAGSYLLSMMPKQYTPTRTAVVSTERGFSEQPLQSFPRLHQLISQLQ